MHTGKYEKLRFTNICRVCEAAGWATECPGPRSSPTTAEWRVMRILYPSVSRHSPSSPPTFFILFSHHTNSYGHKMERGSEQSKIRHRAALRFGFLNLSMPTTHNWQSQRNNSLYLSLLRSPFLSFPTLSRHVQPVSSYPHHSSSWFLMVTLLKHSFLVPLRKHNNSWI